MLVFGIGGVLNYRIDSYVIQPPSEICLSNKFPGKSVSVEEPDFDDRSIFDDNTFFLEFNDKFYSRKEYYFVASI